MNDAQKTIIDSVKHFLNKIKTQEIEEINKNLKSICEQFQKQLPRIFDIDNELTEAELEIIDKLNKKFKVEMSNLRSIYRLDNPEIL